MKSRTAWGQHYTSCFLCGAIRDLSTHEVLRGIYRAKAVREPATWLRACIRCHDQIHDQPQYWTLARQLAVKAIHDGQHYDREAVNEIKRFRDEAGVTEQEVAVAIGELIRTGRIWLPNF